MDMSLVAEKMTKYAYKKGRLLCVQIWKELI